MDKARHLIDFLEHKDLVQVQPTQWLFCDY